MRRIVTTDHSNNTKMVREITLSSTTGINVETYFPNIDSANNDEKVIENQNQILNKLTNAVQSLTDIADRQISAIDESDYIYKTIRIPIVDLTAPIRYFALCSGDSHIPEGSYIKSLKLNITNPFQIGTVISLLFNTQTLGLVTIRDTSILTYDMPIKKVLTFDQSDSNNMNLRVGAPENIDNSEAIAVAEITIGYRNEI